MNSDTEYRIMTAIGDLRVDVVRQFGEVKTKIAKLEKDIEENNNHISKLNGKVAEHEKAVLGFKLLTAKVGGIILTVSAVISTAWNFVVDFVKDKFFS